MKKLFSLLVIFSSILLAQQEKPTSILFQNETNKFSMERLPVLQMNDNEISGKKSGGLAMLYSLILPGMGELYAGSYNSGKYFTIAEGVIWGFYAGMKIYGGWKRENYKDFASSFGGVNPADKDADYYAIIGDYLDVNEYNRLKALDRDYKHMYDANMNYWKWTDQAQRREYRNMWVSSEQAFNNVRFAVGAMIVNRLISAINAIRIVSAHNKNLNKEVSWNLSVNPGNISNPAPADFSFNFVTTF
jgi:hypothetical protein